jgi:hypothetical protein
MTRLDLGLVIVGLLATYAVLWLHYVDLHP